MALEIEISEVSESTSIGQGVDAADIVNGAGSDAMESMVEAAIEVTADDSEEWDEDIEREKAEQQFSEELAEAKESHFNLAVNRSNLEADLKDAKADEKAALKQLKSLIKRGPLYRKPNKIQEAVESSDGSAIEVDDPNADQSWKQVPTSQVIDGIKGLGDKKAETIIELAPTLGDLEELRAEAGKAFKQFAEVLPKGIGQGMADEIEERILTAVGKFSISKSEETEPKAD